MFAYYDDDEDDVTDTITYEEEEDISVPEPVVLILAQGREETMKKTQYN